MADHFYTTTHGEEVEPECVRVGKEPADPVCIPRGSFAVTDTPPDYDLDGTTTTDYTTAYATHFPAAGTTNEVGGGCR